MRLAQRDYTAYHRIIEWLRGNPFLADIILAVMITIPACGGLISADNSTETVKDWDAFAVVLAIGGHAPVAFRRLQPTLTLLAITGFTFVFWVADYDTNFGGAGILIALYSVAAHEPNRAKGWLVNGTVWVAALLLSVVGAIVDGDDLGFGEILAFMTIFGIAVVLGDNVRNRRLNMEQLEERAERAEAMRALEATQAATDERNRIARELHDVVAHSLSVMVVQASAAQRVFDSNPEDARKAIGQVETTGRDSLAEIRRIVDVLRHDDDKADYVPQPGISDLPALAESFREAGLQVSLDASTPEKPLSPGVDLTIYRIVQEGLTNTFKHAGPARATVSVVVDHDAQVVRIDIADDGRGAIAHDSGGHGLVGMQERVDLFAGELRAGPRTGGGYRVTASLPLATAGALQ